jgi:hypothetical protein
MFEIIFLKLQDYIMLYTCLVFRLWLCLFKNELSLPSVSLGQKLHRILQSLLLQICCYFLRSLYMFVYSIPDILFKFLNLQ